MAKGKAAKFVVVLLESLAGTKHRITRVRPRLDNKLEMIKFDPVIRQKVLYREIKKMKSKE